MRTVSGSSVRASWTRSPRFTAAMKPALVCIAPLGTTITQSSAVCSSMPLMSLAAMAADQALSISSIALPRQHLRPAFLHFLRRHILLRRRDHPFVAEGVGQLACAIAVEFVLYGPEQRRAGGHGAIDECVDVVDIEMQRDRTAAYALCGDGAEVRILVRQHDARIADADFGVADLARRFGEAECLLRAKGLGVELNRLRG